MISIRAYARHRKAHGLRGGSLAAVQKAIDVGRLSRSVARDAKGRPSITGAAAADGEWGATTRGEREPPHAVPPLAPSPLAESRARREAAEAAMAEIELAKERGEVVNAAEVKAAWVTMITASRNKLLGIPSRAKQQLPHLTHADIATIDGLIREALEDLAHESENGGER